MSSVSVLKLNQHILVFSTRSESGPENSEEIVSQMALLKVFQIAGAI